MLSFRIEHRALRSFVAHTSTYSKVTHTPAPGCGLLSLKQALFLQTIL